jgi:hypothetical protein
MAQPAGIVATYDAVGNREDLSDKIWDASPSETPLLSALKKTKATGTNHTWQEDALAAAATNAHIEGDDATPVDPGATTLLSNYTQIYKEHAVVSGTQEAVDKAGRNKEMAFQTAKRIKELKLDVEFSLFDNGVANGIGNIKVAGNNTTARESGTLSTYLTSNVSVGATGAAASGNSADVMTTGTDRDLSETILASALTTGYTNGAMPTLLAVSPTNKGVVGDFTAGGATRYVTSDESTLNVSIDVYEGDFHTLKVVPCRQLVGDNVYCIDPEYLAFATLRGLQTKNLAVTGDSMRKEILMEGCLETCTERAHVLIADTNG